MKLIVCFLIVIFYTQLACAFKLNALDYVLNTIEYLASEYSGVFSCVFYDISRRTPYSNIILNEVLQSPRLNHVVKYILNGTFNDDLTAQMPLHPTMLLVYPGNDVDHLIRRDTIFNVISTMTLFDPATKVLVLIDSNARVAREMEETIFVIRYTSSAILNTNTMRATLCNGVYCSDLNGVPHPKNLFTLMRRVMTGRKLTYIVNEAVIPFYWNHKWINETARYLNTEAVEYPNECSGLDADFEKCMSKYRFNSDVADILFACMLVNKSRTFQELYTGIPWFVKIAVPRERPFNAIELILMPFTWHAWTLLVLILVTSELVKRLIPGLFKNDPILLVVCGFERRSLHRAGLCEKFVLQSLIMLMFFMSNAFETKIVSLMIRKPSVKSIKTLDDIVNSQVKFYADMEKIPDLKLNPVIGKLLIQGEGQQLYENVPDTAHMMNNDWTEMLDEMAFDFERMQPYYVVLEDEFFGGNEMYLMQFRSTFKAVFRTIHSNLVEAGLMELWKQQWKDGQIDRFAGRRIKMRIKDKKDLSFDDMQPAWMALVIGFSAGMIGFVGEHVKKWFDVSFGKQKEINSKGIEGTGN